jgi:TolB protein
VWSQDGSKIAFVRSQRIGGDTHVGIYVMKPDGSGITQVIEREAGNLSWSPDGSRILFTACNGGAPDLYVVNADGSGLTRITHTPETEFDPVWQPGSP